MEMTCRPIKSYHVSCNLFFIFILKIYIFSKKEKLGVAETTPSGLQIPSVWEEESLVSRV
jgi:hypothetical protein